LSLALDGTGLGLWDWNLQTGEFVHNVRWGEMLGYAPGEIEPGLDSWEALLHPEDREESKKTLQLHLEGKTPVYESQYRLQTKDGGWKWILDRGKIMERDKDGKPVRAAGTHRDITKEKEYELKLAHLAHHDPLTGLSNRRNLEIQFTALKARAQRHGRRMALLIMDLDGYKAVNDKFGHKVGDLLLKVLAYRFVKLARVDELVVRLGGDEFGILVPEYKRKTALEGLAKRTLKIFYDPFEIEGKKIRVGCSIGISLFPEHGDTLDSLLAAADKAMYDIKWSTKNSYKFADIADIQEEDS
jgi:diguanylate cyclase (GGDEF)-like protein/PAS domain S-box-containing protein